MFTRKQYMAKECTHNEYYGQFVTTGMIEFCIQWFSKEALACQDDNFSNIPLSQKDAAAWDIAQSFPVKLWQELEGKKGYRPSQATYVCVLCAALLQAREWLKQSTTFNDFYRVVHIGRGPDGNIYCAIRVKPAESKGRTLSITGVEGPRADGNCKGSFGQINSTIKEHIAANAIRYAEGWDAEKALRFLGYWEEHHRNDMVAGSPAQQAALRKHFGTKGAGYKEASAYLAAQGLNPDTGFIYKDKPYKYGTAWLTTEVPEDVLKWLFELPESQVKPAWV